MKFETYINEITKALKTGLFTYFAHPDLILTIYESFNNKAEKTARTICELAKKYNTPLEINLNGMTWTLPNRLTYPCEDFWRIAGEIGNEVVIGYDSHYPEFCRETKYLDKALDFVEKYNLKLIKKDKIIQKFIKK